MTVSDVYVAKSIVGADVGRIEAVWSSQKHHMRWGQLYKRGWFGNLQGSPFSREEWFRRVSLMGHVWE